MAGEQIPLSLTESTQRRLDVMPCDESLKKALDQKITLANLEASGVEEKVLPSTTTGVVEVKFDPNNSLNQQMAQLLYGVNYPEITDEQRYFLVTLEMILKENNINASLVNPGDSVMFNFNNGTFSVKRSAKAAPDEGELVRKAREQAKEKSIAEREKLISDLEKSGILYEAMTAYKDDASFKGRVAYMENHKEEFAALAESYKGTSAQNIQYLKIYLGIKRREASGAVAAPAPVEATPQTPETTGDPVLDRILNQTPEAPIDPNLFREEGDDVVIPAREEAPLAPAPVPPAESPRAEEPHEQGAEEEEQSPEYREYLRGLEKERDQAYADLLQRISERTGYATNGTQAVLEEGLNRKGQVNMVDINTQVTLKGTPEVSVRVTPSFRVPGGVQKVPLYATTEIYPLSDFDAKIPEDKPLMLRREVTLLAEKSFFENFDVDELAQHLEEKFPAEKTPPIEATPPAEATAPTPEKAPEAPSAYTRYQEAEANGDAAGALVALKEARRENNDPALEKTLDDNLERLQKQFGKVELTGEITGGIFSLVLPEYDTKVMKKEEAQKYVDFAKASLQATGHFEGQLPLGYYSVTKGMTSTQFQVKNAGKETARW